MENVQSVIPRIALEKNEEIEVLILTSLRRLPIYNSKNCVGLTSQLNKNLWTVSMSF